jgi:hypothetical protein
LISSLSGSANARFIGLGTDDHAVFHPRVNHLATNAFVPLAAAGST